jgi:hypothetical protein
MWSLVDETHANLPEDNGVIVDDNLYSRKSVVLEYLHQFANSVNDPTINVPRMRRVLPRKAGKVYSKQYLRRSHHVNIHWLTKAVNKYRVKVGSVVIAGLTLPKKLGHKAVKQEDVDAVDFAISKLREYYEQVVYETKGLKEAFEQQRSILDFILGGEEAGSDEDKD